MLDIPQQCESIKDKYHRQIDRTGPTHYAEIKAKLVEYFAAETCFRLILGCVDQDSPTYRAFNDRVDNTRGEIITPQEGSFELAAAKAILGLWFDLPEDDEDDIHRDAGLTALKGFRLQRLMTLCEFISGNFKVGTLIDERFIDTLSTLLSKEGEPGRYIAADLRERVAPLLPLTVIH